MSTSYSDMDAHQQLMEALENASEQCLSAADKAVEALDALTEHNSDGLAHADIRNAITKMGTVSLSDVDSRVSDHNVSTSSHDDIRTTLTTLATDISDVRNAIAEQISSHNESSLCHADIRSYINQINAQIGELDYESLRKTIDELEEDVNASIADDIAALRTKDALHDSKIAINIEDIVNLENTANLNKWKVEALTADSFCDKEDRDKLKIQLAAHDYQFNAGLPVVVEDGCSFLDMQTTLPEYIKNDQDLSVSFVVKNIAPAAEGHEVEIQVSSVVEDNVIFSSDEPVVQTTTGAVFTITKVIGSAGDIKLLKITATDTTTEVVSYKIVGFMVVDALNPDSIVCDGSNYSDGLFYNVYPGLSYKFDLVNMVDNDNGRYTYDIQPNNTGLQFVALKDGEPETLSNVLNGSLVTMTVPSAIEANKKYTFKVVASDHLNVNASNTPATVTKEVTIFVNKLNNAETFTITKPTVVVPGESYYISWSGLTSEGYSDIKIIGASSYLTFSDTGSVSSILDNAQIKVTVSAAAPRGEELPFQISYVNNSNETLSINQNFVTNKLPTDDDVVCVINTAVGNKIASESIAAGIFTGGSAVVFHLDGGTDQDDGGQVTYSVSANLSGIKFSRSINIASNSAVTMTLPKLINSTTVTLTVKVLDTAGEYSTGKNFTFVVDPVYYTLVPSITSPSDGQEFKYGSAITMKFTEFKYSISV